MSNINFDNPWLLLIAVPLIVLFTVPFVLAVRKDNRNAHNVASQVMHVLLAIIIAFAAAGTSITTVLTQTHVYVVADVSYSANKNLDTIDNIIKNKLVLPKNSKVGIVTFGKDYELLCDLTDQKNVVSVKKSIENKTVDDSETNIAEALEYAGTLFEKDVIKRVVLITDGKQTDEVDTSAMRRAIDSLESQDIKVDAYFLDSNLSSDKPEVQISGAEYTTSAFINHDERVNVTIQTNCETQALLYLSKNGVQVHVEAADLTVGRNTVQMKLDTTESGTFDYEVKIQTIPEENDASDYNNNYSFTQMVSNNLKILVVTQDWSDVSNLAEKYSESGSVDIFENASVPVMDKTGVYAQLAKNEKVNLYCYNKGIADDNGYITTGNVPYTIEDICEYDEIILSNVNVGQIPNSSRFIQSLDIAVATFGKSLITLGNTYIQGSSNSALRKLSDMLPVRFGQSDDAPKLYTIILDSSRSMWAGGDTRKIELAQEYAKLLVTSLAVGDELFIIGFYGDAWSIYGPRTYDGSAIDIYKAISSVTVRQGTVLSGALEMAKSIMTGEASDAYGDKQLMVITDGKDNGNDGEVSRELVTDLSSEGVVTSVIYLGRSSESGTTVSTEARKLCVDMASIGKGKYYYFDGDKTTLPDDLTFGQMMGNLNQTEVEKETEVVINRKLDDVLSYYGTSLSDIPSVDGYYVSTAKASATSVLQVKHKKQDDSIKNLPLYSYWNYGNGKVASFTSTLSWLSDWVNKKVSNTEDSAKNLDNVFFANVLDVNVPDRKNDYPYTLSVIQDGNATKVLLTPHKDTLHFDAKATVKLVLPDGELVEENLVFDKDHYYYNFKSAEMGRYQIEVMYSYTGYDYGAMSVINVSYESEYDEFAAFEASPLFRAVNGRGQVIIEGDLVLENEEHEMGTYTNDFTIPLLIIAVSLFVVDIIVRKLKWEDIVSFFGGFKKSGGKKS